jgi:hypothetical protein
MGIKYTFTEEQINEMLVSYNEHFESLTSIANRYGVDREVIDLRLKKRGIIIPKFSPYNKQYWIERGMSPDRAEYHVKTLRPSNPEYWISKGYSELEAKRQVSGTKLASLDGCIAKYGEIEGSKIWYDRTELRSICGKTGSANIEYWLKKGYSESEAIIKRSERQSTFSKEKCIEKYGEEEGLKIFTERQTKWTKSLNSGGNLKVGHSKVSQELFYKLLEYYDIEDRDKIYFATHNKEYRLNKFDGGIWLYDFTDIKNKKIIEYNGDMFHGNPKKYKSSDYPHPFKKNVTADEIWCSDKIKTDTANKEGFEVLVIWDSEYRWGNKDSIIEKCVKFLKS